MSAERAIKSEELLVSEELSRDQFPIQDTGEIETLSPTDLEARESSPQLDELMTLREEFRAWSDELLDLEETANCRNNNFRKWMTRDCCLTHELAMEIRGELIERAQKLTGDTRKHPMGGTSADAPFIFTREWFSMWERKFSEQ